ncbi:LTA synthase family protein [Clostridium swellfunianum]|uniref:LTA synthase family protein n=1 Tax=Clostridium swellfunianum TaxID=1367462 RepID=UPI0020301B83|nr:LTA synthase family protein [Clostridium swellfunianum]MCM0650886.1 LTA synthase family protein [Clostridium swellfunianum]
MDGMLTKITKVEYKTENQRSTRNFIMDNLLLVITILLLFIKSLMFISIAASPSGANIALNTLSYYGKNYFLHISFIVMLVSLAYIFKGKVQVFVLILINFLISIMLFSDLIYYRGFQGFMSVYNLSQTGNLNSMGESIASMFRPVDILFFIDILVLLVIRKRMFYKNARRKVLGFAVLLILGAGIPFYHYYRYDVIEDGANRRYFYNYFSPMLNISVMSPIGYHIHDAASYFENSKRLALNDEDKNQIKAWYDSNKENLPDNEYKAIFKGKNLIFVQVESLEAFLINQKIEGQEITPSLNSIIKNSLYFPNIYEQVSGGNSSDADLMVNTSTHPVRSGSTFFRFPDNKYNSMPVLMKKQGYYTSAFHPDGGGYWNWMPALQSMDFDKTVDTVGFTVDETIGYGLSDESFLRQMKDKLVKQPQPFYSFFVTLTSHMPFVMPEDKKELKLSDNIGGTVLGDYFQSIRYTDKHIGKFLEGLDKEGILDNTVVVIYGDHTGVHKYYKDKLKTIEPKEQWWAEDSMRVPMIIYSKGMEGKQVGTIGGHVDIMPTALYLMGIDEQEYTNTAMGRNLLKTNRNHTILSNGVFVGGAKSEEEKQKAIEALEISDKMLRSNYFKDHK